GSAIDLGHVILGTQPIARTYTLPLSDLTRHVFVAGVTGAGKTHTIFQLLKQVQRADVSFLVIEPSKAEYRSLLNDGQLADRLQVFTLGNERISPFRLNPFEVLPGIPVGVHLDLLRSAFSASMGMWTPLPQVLEQCLHAIYIDRGWDIANNTNHRLDPDAEPWMAFPTLSDLIAKVDEVTRQLGYDERVTSDIRAALLTRLNALRAGGKGRMLDVRRSLPISSLMEQPTVLELEGLGDDDDKAFVMGLLLIMLVEYRRVQAKKNGLRHLLVIEEAHRLLANVSTQSRQEEANPRGNAVETFANLLAEIRAYGQGVVIADQVPVKLAPDVIKNTNLKIAHRVVAADDRAVLAGAMAMNEQQAHSLAILTVGQAAFFSEGDDAPVLVQIPPTENNSKNTEPVQDSRLKQYQGNSIILKVHHDLFQRLPACIETCREADQACTLASRVVEDAGFQRVFSRLVLSSMEDTNAVDRLWPELVTVVRPLIPRHIAESQLFRSLATHAADWFAQRRGAQAGWSYSSTDALATVMRRMLLAKLDTGEIGSIPLEYRHVVLANHARFTDPFPACGRICQQTPPVCLYRYAVADLIARPEFKEVWHSTSKTLWEICYEASLELVEFPGSDGPLVEDNAIFKTARRVCLCLGQQMLAKDLTIRPRTAANMMNQLFQEAHHE
ncbi:MAG: ATP-binding protein, partial [Candidatus Promineifilaceae bacterium]|nr:ATP-binding protein [Candidatus Promineifilaceae bacterium]